MLSDVDQFFFERDFARTARTHLDPVNPFFSGSGLQHHCLHPCRQFPAMLLPKLSLSLFFFQVSSFLFPSSSFDAGDDADNFYSAHSLTVFSVDLVHPQAVRSSSWPSPSLDFDLSCGCFFEACHTFPATTFAFSSTFFFLNQVLYDVFFRCMHCLHPSVACREITFFLRKRNPLTKKKNTTSATLDTRATNLCRVKTTSCPTTSRAHRFQVSLGFVDVYCALEVVDIVACFAVELVARRE